MNPIKRMYIMMQIRWRMFLLTITLNGTRSRIREVLWVCLMLFSGVTTVAWLYLLFRLSAPGAIPF